MQSDAWWSFAMAVNVFMVFFFSTNPLAFRRYLWVYCLICFGLPMIPAVVCLAIKHERGPVYGNATVRDSYVSLSPRRVPDRRSSADSPWNATALVLDWR